MKKSFFVIFMVFFMAGVFTACNLEENERDKFENSIQTSELVSETKNSNLEKDKADLFNTDSSTAVQNNAAAKKDNTKIDTAEETIGNNADNKNEIFTVTFKDYDGTVLKVEKVEKGENATAPSKPTREGYRFIKWNTAFDNVQVDITTMAVYDEITLPTLCVEEVDCYKGDIVAVKVSALNNPGILGMLMNITYDENAMTLEKAENGSVMSEYMFTPPKNIKSGCNVAWNINDVPSENKDGDVLILYFKVSEKAKAGSYPISVSCLGGAFDSEYNAVSFDTINGTLNIKK